MFESLTNRCAITAAKLPPKNENDYGENLSNRKTNSLPAESPEIATRFGSIFNFCALVGSRTYFVTAMQSSSPAGNGFSGARRYLNMKINSNQSQLRHMYSTEITINPVRRANSRVIG